MRAAGPLTVTVLSIAISNIFKLYQAPYNIKTVGVVPAVSHLPSPSHALSGFLSTPGEGGATFEISMSPRKNRSLNRRHGIVCAGPAAPDGDVVVPLPRHWSLHWAGHQGVRHRRA